MNGNERIVEKFQNPYQENTFSRSIKMSQNNIGAFQFSRTEWTRPGNTAGSEVMASALGSQLTSTANISSTFKVHGFRTATIPSILWGKLYALMFGVGVTTVSRWNVR